MPKTEAELRNWVVEYNQRTTHDRSLVASYGYNRILDTDLVAVCAELREKHEPPIRVLDVGCGNGKALTQLADRLQSKSLNSDDFEFWGIGVNRYDDMLLPENRLILEGLMAHDFAGQQFHLVVSVFAFHYLWHKLEAIEKIYNQLLFDGGKAFLHFPGYLVRFGETPELLRQNEADGNRRWQDYLAEQEAKGLICPMHYKNVPHYSDDDDCVLLAEFGHVRFEKQPEHTIEFDQELQAFGMFEDGFKFQYMNQSERTYIASYYAAKDGADDLFPENSFPASELNREEAKELAARLGGSQRLPSGIYIHGPYRVTSEPFEAGGKPYDLDIAVHEYDSDRVILICPGGLESLAGRVVAYAELAEAIVQSRLGAVVRYCDPYDYQCDYAEFLVAKTRCMIEFALETASQFCNSAKPKLEVMAYSSSAGAIAKFAQEYEIETLLLIAPSHDLPYTEILPTYREYRGNVRVLVGESDEIVLPHHAFWYYENAVNAASREYVEARSCGHFFEGQANKSLFFHAPLWAFGDTRPAYFPPSRTKPSEAWC